MRVGKWMFILTVVCVAALRHIQAVSALEACGAPARLDFTLRDVQGREIALRHFRGNVVLINFWATWCAPCRVEIPSLVGLYDKYRARGFVVLGVSVDDPATPLAPFVKELGMTYPVLAGAGRRDFLDAFGELAGFPTSFLISRDGKICARHAGLVNEAQLERRILALL